MIIGFVIYFFIFIFVLCNETIRYNIIFWIIGTIILYSNISSDFEIIPIVILISILIFSFILFWKDKKILGLTITEYQEYKSKENENAKFKNLKIEMTLEKELDDKIKEIDREYSDRIKEINRKYNDRIKELNNRMKEIDREYNNKIKEINKKDKNISIKKDNGRLEYKILDLEQGSDEWLEFRKGKITASAIASIMGLGSAFQTKKEIAQVIKGEMKITQTEAMKKGLEYEPIIRKKAERIFKDKIKPIVIQSIDEPLFMASLDGISLKDKNIIYEFKYSNWEFNNVSFNEAPSENYYAQVQFQLYISKAEKCRYVVMDKSFDIEYCEVKSNISFQNEILKKIQLFEKKYLKK